KKPHLRFFCLRHAVGGLFACGTPQEGCFFACGTPQGGCFFACGTPQVCTNIIAFFMSSANVLYGDEVSPT
ncbi:TPA: hypothetical protein ACPY32_005572, partial [Klebsiella variicola subsp. variicola]